MNLKERIDICIGLVVYGVLGGVLRYFTMPPCGSRSEFSDVIIYIFTIIGIVWGLHSLFFRNGRRSRIGQGIITGYGVGFGGMTVAIIMLNLCTDNGALTSLIDTDANLVYGTWALVGVTLLGIIITAILTKKSLNETKRATDLHRFELEHRLRTDIRYAPQNSHMDKAKSKFRINGVLNNEGLIEAHSFQVHVFSFKNNPTIEQILQNENEIKKNSLPIEGSFPYQQRTFQFSYPIEWNFEGEIFVVLWIRCKFFEDSEDEKIYVLRCYGEPCETANIFTKNNIALARKEFKRSKGL